MPKRKIKPSKATGKKVGVNPVRVIRRKLTERLILYADAYDRAEPGSPQREQAFHFYSAFYVAYVELLGKYPRNYLVEQAQEGQNAKKD